MGTTPRPKASPSRQLTKLQWLACASSLWSLACPVDDRKVVTQDLQPAATAGTGGRAGMADDAAVGPTDVSGQAGMNVPVLAPAGAGGLANGMSPPSVLAPPDKLDLLFMVDNSISMSDKQEILRQALPDLMSRLVNPVCLDAAGNEQAAPPPGGACPAGQRRQFEPLSDVHVGIVSSSLGDGGANAACAPEGFAQFAPERNDLGHLMGSLARNTAQTNAQGFLEWRAGTTSLDTFTQNAQRMVTDVGENGCGWEHSLESWYRFLIDPAPHASLARVTCPDSTSTATNCVAPALDATGQLLLDDTLLAQRAAFLRDDSLVAIIMLSDENDCSIQVGDQTWVAYNTQDMRPMFKGSTTCATDANAKCCYSCPLEPPDGCPVDPACTTDAINPNRLLPEQDGQNLRCFQQKRRFGTSFLYPTQRYVNALTQPQLCLTQPDLGAAGCPVTDLRPNPLFRAGRPPRHVVLGGIIGVPWQAIASDETARGQLLGTPDVLRFKPYQELTDDGVWAQILGSPGVEWQAATETRPEVASAAAFPPSLAQMVESSQFPRPGVDPGNPINGRDYDTALTPATQATGAPRPDDLQYSCIFPLATPRVCTLRDPNVDNCDCYTGVFNRPLCEQTPGVSAPGPVQYWGKAYPSLRQLSVLKDFGAVTGNSVVASICARNVTDTSKADYGYRPAVAAIVERLQDQLDVP
jgi:hypothetical protein